MTQAPGRARFRDKSVDVVIDVRTKLEFWLGHLPGALHIPVDGIMKGVADHDIGKDSRILVYCASGARSATAARELRAAGFRHVLDAGGYSAAASDFTPAAGA